MNGFVLGIAGEAKTSNPEHTGPDDTENAPGVYSTQQEALYTRVFLKSKVSSTNFGGVHVGTYISK